MATSVFEQAVRVGRDHVVHIQNGLSPRETRCGLGGSTVELTLTDEAPTCKYCEKPARVHAKRPYA